MNIIEENEKVVREAVTTYGLGEDIHHTVFGSVIPGQNGQPQPILVIVLSIPGLGLGERLIAQTMSANFILDPQIEFMVSDMIEQLKTQRSQQAQDAMKAGDPISQQNGQGQHHPGLIDPRQGM